MTSYGEWPTRDQDWGPDDWESRKHCSNVLYWKMKESKYVDTHFHYVMANSEINGHLMHTHEVSAADSHVHRVDGDLTGRDLYLQDHFEDEDED